MFFKIRRMEPDPIPTYAYHIIENIVPEGRRGKKLPFTDYINFVLTLHVVTLRKIDQNNDFERRPI